MPLTIPDAFTVAIAGLLLLHVPPCVPFVLRKINEPVHTDDGPLIVPAFAVALTVICFVATVVVQPFTVYLIVVTPAPAPVTNPAFVTVAIEVLSLVHVPPDAPSVLKATLAPVHTSDGPLNVPATGPPVTITVWNWMTAFPCPSSYLHATWYVPGVL